VVHGDHGSSGGQCCEPLGEAVQLGGAELIRTREDNDVSGVELALEQRSEGWFVEPVSERGGVDHGDDSIEAEAGLGRDDGDDARHGTPLGI